MKKIVILLFLSLLISSDLTANEIDDPSKRINEVYGVSVLPPQEKGWEVLHKTRHN